MVQAISPVPQRSQSETSPGSFYFIYVLVLLAIVVLGFAPSALSQLAGESPALPLYLHAHGALMLAWFLLLLNQAWLIRVGEPALHRRLGYWLAGLGLLVAATGLAVTFISVSRGIEQGISFETDMADVNPGMGVGISYLDFVTRVLWLNTLSSLSFLILLGLAIYYRHLPAVHKRLVLIASVSLVGPALARLSRLEFLGGEQGPFVPLALLSLLLGIVIHDLITRRRPHRASLAGMALIILASMVAMGIASSEFGVQFVRNLA